MRRHACCSLTRANRSLRSVRRSSPLSLSLVRSSASLLGSRRGILFVDDARSGGALTTLPRCARSRVFWSLAERRLRGHPASPSRDCNRARAEHDARPSQAPAFPLSRRGLVSTRQARGVRGARMGPSDLKSTVRIDAPDSARTGGLPNVLAHRWRSRGRRFDPSGGRYYPGLLPGKREFTSVERYRNRIQIEL
jgi:hypothetical protein